MTSFILLVWALICHNPNHIPGKTNCPLQHVIVTTMGDDGDDGNGDSGTVPPKPPTPPKP